MTLTIPRLLRWALGIALLVLLVLGALAYRSTPGLPQGLIPPDGRYDVRILRDHYGVPHIFGRRDSDVAYGLAYAHAEDDFPTIQGALLAARGRLASVYGKDAAANDYMVALLDIERVVSQGYPRLPDDVRALCQAYAEGLNHYAALHPDEALSTLYPVEGQDVVAGFVHKIPLFFGIDKVLKGFLEAPGAAGPRNATHTPDETTSDRIKGSNAIALAPARTDDGSTILVINSHQPWEGPVAWYEAHVHSDEGWHAAGALFPGAPLILHGHNQHLGWAHTVNRPDLVDEYELVVDPENPDTYRFDDRRLTLDKRVAELDVKLFGPFHWTFKREVLASVHGPVMRTEHGTFALRFSGFGEVRQLEQWYRMNKAESLEEWKQAMAMTAIPMFNTVYADSQGNIGYLYNGRLPQRTEGFDYAGRLPGDTSEVLWDHDAPLPFEALPQVWNPPTGFVQNCNNTPFRTTQDPHNPDPAAFPDTLGIESRMTNRALRALSLFADPETLSLEQVLARKFDTTYAADSALARLRSRALGLEPEGAYGEAAEVLAAFDLETDLDDPHAALAVIALGPFLEPPVEPTDDELRRSVLDAASTLREHFGSLEVPWGEVNRLRRGETDLPLAGAPDVLHAVYGTPESDGRLRGVAGDCFVMVARWADGDVSSQSLHQYGSATLDETSPHYADQAQLFADRRLKQVLWHEAHIQAQLTRSYRPGEEVEP